MKLCPYSVVQKAGELSLREPNFQIPRGQLQLKVDGENEKANLPKPVRLAMAMVTLQKGR